eukprot:3869522-Rhodomonas_salina.1
MEKSFWGVRLCCEAREIRGEIKCNHLHSWYKSYCEGCRLHLISAGRGPAQVSVLVLRLHVPVGHPLASALLPCRS